MRKLRLIHRWIGLILVLPLICQGITGFILTATPLATRLTLPQAMQGDGPPHRVSDVVAAAQAAAPPGLVPSRYRVGANPIAGVDFVRPGKAAVEARIWVDPNSLATLPVSTDPDTVFHFAHDLHEVLLIEGSLGHSIIGWCGIGLFVMAATGLVLWWPLPGRILAAFTVSAKARGYRFQRELHGAAGIALFGLLLLQSVSGASMAFPETARSLVGAPAPAKLPARSAAAAAFDLDAAVAAAQTAVPDAALRDIRLPVVAGRPASVALLPDGSAEGAPMVLVRFDAAGNVANIDDPRHAGFGAALLAWLRTLHEGRGLGPGWTAVIAALGLLLPVSAMTGATMWLIRQRRRIVSRALLHLSAVERRTPESPTAAPPS
jgi:uncharacterized iron-regulated membrane protein